MAKDSQKKPRIFTRAGAIYSNTVCGCDGRRSVVNSTVSQMSRQIPTKEIDSEDLQGLMRILSGGGTAVDVDSEGNLVWRKEAAERSYGGGVGRIGRIDEEKACSFSEVDVRYSRSLSDVIGVDKRRRVLASYSKN